MRGKRWIEISAVVMLAVVISAAVGGWQAWVHYKRSLNRSLVVALDREEAAKVRTLVARGADYHTVGTAGTTVLMIAASSGDMAFLNAVIRGNPDINDADLSRHTALTYAVVRDREAAVQLLLAHGADPNRGSRGATPLTWAARWGRTRICRMLLDAGADPNIRLQSDGSSPLMRAADQGHAGVVALLLERQADPNLRDHGGNTAADRAQQHGHAGLAALLRKASARHLARVENKTATGIGRSRSQSSLLWKVTLPSPGKGFR